MNRVETKIAAKAKELSDKLASGILTQEKIDAANKSLDMPLNEFVMFQNLKSLAVANGMLTLEEGNSIYKYLGETPETFNHQKVEVKAILTVIYSELLNRKIAGRL